MVKKTSKIFIFTSLIFTVIILFVGLTFAFNSKSYVSKEVQGASSINKGKDYFQYEGVENRNALYLLKSKASIKLDRSGMVSSINERASDSSKQEYWAFYVNGKLANVGPADYITKNGEKIEWKIEKF